MVLMLKILLKLLSVDRVYVAYICTLLKKAKSGSLEEDYLSGVVVV